MYIGAKYIGKQKIRVGRNGGFLNEGDILSIMKEWEAKARPDFEPVYKGKETKKKQEKEYDNFNEE